MNAFAPHITNQLYILSGHIDRKASALSRARETDLLTRLARTGIESDRITLTPVFAHYELIQIWRVPPGANNPTCNECERAASCPRLAVTVSAEKPRPGDTLVFTATLSNGDSGKVNHRWLVAAGTIVGGHGTPSISVATDRSIDEVTAMVEATGLPEACPNNASRTVKMDTRGVILLDEFASASARRIRSGLNHAAIELAKRPGWQLIFIIYTSKSESRSSRRRRETFIRNYLTAVRKIDPSRLFFVSGGVHASSTRIYIAPSGTYEKPLLK